MKHIIIIMPIIFINIDHLYIVTKFEIKVSLFFESLKISNTFDTWNLKMLKISLYKPGEH